MVETKCCFHKAKCLTPTSSVEANSSKTLINKQTRIRPATQNDNALIEIASSQVVDDQESSSSNGAKCRYI